MFSNESDAFALFALSAAHSWAANASITEETSGTFTVQVTVDDDFRADQPETNNGCEPEQFTVSNGSQFNMGSYVIEECVPEDLPDHTSVTLDDRYRPEFVRTILQRLLVDLLVEMYDNAAPSCPGSQECSGSCDPIELRLAMQSFSVSVTVGTISGTACDPTKTDYKRPVADIDVELDEDLDFVLICDCV